MDKARVEHFQSILLLGIPQIDSRLFGGAALCPLKGVIVFGAVDGDEKGALAIPIERQGADGLN